MHIAATNPTANDFPGSETGVQVVIGAGSFSVSEAGPSGYAAAMSGCSGTMTLGGSATCTITNSDIAPQLLIVKQVVNTHGGTATPSAFSGTINGIAAVGGNNWSGSSTTKSLLGGGAYTVSENPAAGYTASFSPDCAGTITIGQTKTCTISNQDQAGTLTVIKHVNNTYGGTLTASAFSGSFSGITATNGNTWSGASTTKTITTIGSYTVTENQVFGYAASYSADCSGSISSGNNKTCTITNSDIAP